MAWAAVLADGRQFLVPLVDVLLGDGDSIGLLHLRQHVLATPPIRDDADVTDAAFLTRVRSCTGGCVVLTSGGRAHRARSIPTRHPSAASVVLVRRVRSTLIPFLLEAASVVPGNAGTPQRLQAA